MKFLKRNWTMFFIVGVLLMSFVTMASAQAPIAVTGVTQVSEVAHQADEEPAATPPIDLATDLAAAGPIIVIVTGLVSLIKGAGVKGVWLTVSSLLLGALWGIAYKYALAPLTTFSGWFWAIGFGVILGLIACGVYDAYGNGKSAVPKTSEPTVTQ